MAAVTGPSAREDLRRVEEEGDLLARRVCAVGAVHDVALDALRQVADRALRAFFGSVAPMTSRCFAIAL
jgi:hypothetical protein